MVKDDSFVTILPFMVNELHLKGNELLVYAVIYGFTMYSNDTWYTGSARYLAEWCGCSKKTIFNVLKKLVNMGVLEKRSSTVNGVTLVDYRALRVEKQNVEDLPPSEKNSTPLVKKFPYPSEKNSTPPSEKISTHNIDGYTIEDKKERKKAPPSLSEVASYISEKDYGLDPQEFIDVNEMRGWKQKNGKPIEDWKACVRVFERNRKKWDAEKAKEKGELAWQIENYVP